MSDIWKHRDGGYYKLVAEGKMTTDTSDVVIYVHLWPFENNHWVRPAKEFYDGRFKRVTNEDMDFYYASNESTRKSYQERVSANKAARKLKESDS